MKTAQQIRNELTQRNAYVFPSDYFLERMRDGRFTAWQGNGYFHDGENETTISVRGGKVTADTFSKYPYVIWHQRL